MVTEIIGKAMAEIKIRELSIGDWVEIDGAATKVWYLSQDSEVNDTTYDWVEPIPLTPEILEKNGWAEYSDVHNSWKLDIADNMRVWMFKNSHDWTFQVMNWGLGHNHCIAKAYITSIHQLQHALRLAGVGKEVVL